MTMLKFNKTSYDVYDHRTNPVSDLQPIRPFQRPVAYYSQKSHNNVDRQNHSPTFRASLEHYTFIGGIAGVTLGCISHAFLPVTFSGIAIGASMFVVKEMYEKKRHAESTPNETTRLLSIPEETEPSNPIL